MEQQRMHNRYTLQSPLIVDIKYSDCMRPLRGGLVRDISNGGLFVETEHALEECSYVNAILRDDNMEEQIWFQGLVVRVSAHGMAIAFTYTDERLKSYLEPLSRS